MTTTSGRTGGLLRALATLAVAVAAAGPGAAGETPAPGSYDLTVTEDRVSLHAVDGSLLRILEDLGGRVGFELVADAAQDSRVSARFENLPVDQAIRRIVGKLGYVEVSDRETGRTSRLILTSKNVRLSRTASKPYEPPLREDPVIVEPAVPEPETPSEPSDDQTAEQDGSAADTSGSAATPRTRRLKRKDDRSDDD